MFHIANSIANYKTRKISFLRKMSHCQNHRNLLLASYLKM